MRLGVPLMHPIFFEEPDNSALFDCDVTYFRRNDFLIGLIVEVGAKAKEVYFLGSSNWFNFYTGDKYQDGTLDLVKISPAYIPTFVRGRAIIPMAKPM